MPGTTDTVKAKLTPGEFVIRKEAVDMIGVPMLNKINNMPKEGGHSAIDNLINMATLSNMKMMYGGGMVKAGSTPMQMGGVVKYGHGGQVKNKNMMSYGHGGMVKDKMMMMEEGGQLKAVPEDNPGLGKLPEMVRNRMGYMQDGGMVASNVFRGIGANFDKANLDMDNGMYNMKRVLSIPAEQVGEGSGLRYYAGEANADQLEALRSMTFMDAAEKMNISPQDSIPVAMIEEYLAPKKKKGLRGLLGFKDGGMVEDSLMGMRYGGMAKKKKMMGYQEGGQAMNSDDPLQIDMRMQNPSIYEGQTLGIVRNQANALNQSINQDIVNKALKTLELMKLRGILNEGVPIESSGAMEENVFPDRMIGDRKMSELFTPMPYMPR